MADPFLDYLDDLGQNAPADDRNSVLLCQAIVSVLRRHAIYPDLTRFALETLGGMDPSTQDDNGADLTLAIRLARDLGDNAVRRGKGKQVKALLRSRSESLGEVIVSLERHVAKGRFSDRMGVILRNTGLLAEMFKLEEAEARLLFAAFVCQNYAPFDLFADGLLSRSKSLAHAVSCLMGVDEYVAARICAQDSPLACSGLVAFDRSSRLFMSAVATSNSIDHVIQDAHGSVEAMRAALLGPAVVSHLTIDDFPHLADQLGLLVRVLAGAISNGAVGVNILLHGLPGTGKTQLAMVLAAAAGGPLMAVGEQDDDDNEPNRGERLGHLLMLQKLLGAQNTGICMFDEMEDLFQGIDRFRSGLTGSKVFLNRLLETNPHPVIWIANDIDSIPVWLRRRMLSCIQIDHPPAQVQAQILTRIVQDLGLSLEPTEIAELARVDGIAPGVIRNAVYATQLAGGGLPEVRASLEGLSRAVTGGPLVIRQNDAGSGFDPELSVADLDLALLADGLAGSKERAFSLCLFGAPGTGKSAYARHLAARLGMTVLQKRTSDLLGPFVGQTERAIAAAFAEARDKGAFLIFDEADSLLFDRSNATRQFEVSQVSEMLTWMESHPLPFACTTNLMDRLDDASLRRFTFKVKFDYLGLQQSKACFRRVFGCEPPLGLGRLARLTPADFHVVAKKARVLGQSDNAEGLLDLLSKESAAKGDVAASIGFRMVGAAEQLKSRAS